MNRDHVADIPESLLRAMDEYFASIKDAFRTTVEYKSPKSFADPLIGYSVAALVFSIFPILPLLAWGFIQWKFSRVTFYLHGSSVPVHSFGAWWIGCVAFAGLALAFLVKVDSSTTSKKQPDLLSDAAQRFAFCYATAMELEKFTKNRIGKHVEEAIRYWTRLRMMLESMLGRMMPFHFEPGYIYAGFDTPEILDGRHEDIVRGSTKEASRRRFRSFFSDLLVFERKFNWFKLAPNTSRIIDALDSLVVKIPGRLRDKKDIHAVSDVLRRLATYLYTTIPELAENSESEKTNEISERALLSFVDAIEPLSVYIPERKPLAGKERVKSKFLIFCSWIIARFDSENMLLRFLAWWAMAQLLVLAGWGIASHYVSNLKPELLISILIPTPMLVAAAALAAHRKEKL